MSFFKAYDMRGTFGKDFDLAEIERIGKALPGVVGGGRWLVGRDGRVTSEAIRDALVRGLTAAGADVTDLGLATTPMVYFYTGEEDFAGSVMITASHNPPGDNGLKVSRRGGLPVGYDSGLKEVEKASRQSVGAARPRAAAPQPSTLNSPLFTLHSSLFTLHYTHWLLTHTPPHTGLRVAVDCSNGMAALLAHELFPDATFLNDVIDGRFPNHSPNPLLAEARAQLVDAVRAGGFDCGVIFDGDADRCMFVDETGAFIQPDFLIPVLAATFDERGPVIHDVRTSRAVLEQLREQGFEPRMVPVGHAHAKVKLREYKAICGGELAGHYYFRDFHGCDSGALAARRILSVFAQAKARGQKVSSFMRPLLTRYANSGELNFTVADKDAAIQRLLAAAATLAPEIGRETMDGYRLEYAAGWISIRKSNTEPYLRLIIECDTPARLAAWRRTLEAALATTPPARSVGRSVP